MYNEAVATAKEEDSLDDLEESWGTLSNEAHKMLVKNKSIENDIAEDITGKQSPKHRAQLE